MKPRLKMTKLTTVLPTRMVQRKSSGFSRKPCNTAARRSPLRIRWRMRKRFIASTPVSIPEKRKESATQNSAASKMQHVGMAHRFLTTSTSNSRMRRSSAACTVRRKPATVTDSPGAGTTSNWRAGPGRPWFRRRADPASGGYSRRKLSRRTAPPTRQRTSAELFQDGPFGGVFGAKFAQHFGQNVLDGDDAGRAAKFIQDNGQPALLALQALQQLQQIHALRHEGRKLDGQRQVGLRVEQQAPAY